VLCAALEAVQSGALSAAEILELEQAVSERVARRPSTDPRRQS